jgi:hypothetical protein
MIDRETGPDPNYTAGFEVSFLGLIHARYGVLDNDYTMYGAGVGWDFGNVLFRLDFAHTRQEDAFPPGVHQPRSRHGRWAHSGCVGNDPIDCVRQRVSRNRRVCGDRDALHVTCCLFPIYLHR